MVVSSATSALSNLDAEAESHRRALDTSNAMHLGFRARTQVSAPCTQTSPYSLELQPHAPKS